MQDIGAFLMSHPLLSLAVLVVFILLTLIELQRAKATAFNISPAKAIRLINHDNALVLDIRVRDLYNQGHILGAQSENSADIKSATKRLEKYKSRPLVIVCALGVESQKTAAALLKQGYRAYSLAGGMKAWLEGQMPTVKE